MEYVREEGYLNMLNVLGANLREWLSNVNDLHVHLKTSLPDATFPQFWCVDDEEAVEGQESMILHYVSEVIRISYFMKYVFHYFMIIETCIVS